MSKLPRLSKTDDTNSTTAPLQGEATPSPHQLVYVPYAAPGGPEAWISFAMGALVLLLNHNFLRFLAAPKKFVEENPVLLATGGTLKYTDSYLFWGDLVITAFAFALMLDAIVLLKSRNKIVVASALAITFLTVAGNLAYLLLSYNAQGLAMLSAIAVGYGVYIAIFQWRLLKMIKSENPR